MEQVKLGVPPHPGQGRDAVHVAVIAMVAGRELQPGERLKSGIVDPFLTAPVKPGEWYWLCLTPGTTTSLRHVWAHPGFDDEDTK